VGMLPLRCGSCERVFAFPWAPAEGQAVSCPGCGRRARLEQGLLVLDAPIEAVRGGGGREWNLEKFEKDYASAGTYFDHLERARQSNIPAEAEHYRHERVKGWIVARFASLEGGLFLDVGTGAGYMIYQLRQAYPARSFRFVGADVSGAHMRSLALRAGQDDPRFVMPVIADAESLPFSSDTFDAVTCSEVIEHVYDKRKAMLEMSRILKPGGVLLLTTPRRSQVEFWKLLFALPRRLYRLLKGKGGRIEEELAYDEPLEPGELRAMAQAAGLRIEELSYAVCLPHESYLQFLPSWLLRLWLAFARMGDALCVGFLIGLHMRMQARKVRG